MSRRTDKTVENVVNKIDYISRTEIALCDEFVMKNCGKLDKLISNIYQDINNLTDQQVESYILELATQLYYVSSCQEMVGIKEDVCKMFKAKIYNEARREAQGTVADKDAQALLISQNESLALNVYTRAYKTIKAKVESGYEVLNSLKKIMNRRLAEIELSNSRYIGGNNTDEHNKR